MSTNSVNSLYLTPGKAEHKIVHPDCPNYEGRGVASYPKIQNGDLYCRFCGQKLEGQARSRVENES